MRRVALLTLVGLLIGLALPARAQDGDSLTVIDADTEGRTVTLTVVAPPELLDVEIDDGTFLVTVDGVQRIPEVERIRGDELEAVLVIDTSGSMGGSSLNAAKAAAVAFIDQMPLGTLFSVVGFGEDATVLSEFTTDRDVTVEAINGVVAEGNTALYKAVVTAAGQFDPRSTASRNIVLLSDGGNTVEESSLGLAQSAVQATGATLYAISLLTDDTNIEDLEAMVAGSGGSVTSVGDLAGLEALYGDFATTLRNQYLLTFQGSGEGTVEVFVAARDGGTTLASGRLDVQMPVRALPRPTATPIPATVDSGPVAVATAPATMTVDASDPTWMRWAASVSLAASLGIFGYLLLFPDKRRRNPLREYAPAVARASSDTARGIRGIPSALTSLTDRVLSRTSRGLGLARWLEAAGLQVRNSEFLVLVGLVSISAFFVGAWVSFVFGLTLTALVIALIVLSVSVLVSRRREAFANQLNATLQMMAGSLRTGYSLAQVFDVVARESESPTSDEFTRIVVESRLGRDLVESCRDTAERMDNEDFMWVTNAIEITREIGGDLAEVLDNVAATIRTRERIRRQISALSAEGRISAIILAILPIPMFLWQLLVNRDYTMLLFNNGLGRAIFFTAVGALLLGIVWMSRLTKLRF